LVIQKSPKIPKDSKPKAAQKKVDSKHPKPSNAVSNFKAYSENETITKKESNFTLHLEARRFAQGEVILLRLTPNDSKWMEESYKLVWMGKEIPITKQAKSQIAFLPIPPEAKPGSTILEIQSKYLFLENESKQYEIELLQTQYTIVKKHTITVDNKFVTQELSPETLAFIQECVKAKEVAFSKSGSLAFQDKFTLTFRIHFHY
jgi:murein DD-endopeptidase